MLYSSICVSGHNYVNRGHKTYMAGTVNSVPLLNVHAMETRRFSMPFLMTWCHQIDLPKSKLNTEFGNFLLHCMVVSTVCIKRYFYQNQADLHPYFQKIFCSINLTPDPIVGGGVSPSPEHSPHHVSTIPVSELPRPLHVNLYKS